MIVCGIVKDIKNVVKAGNSVKDVIKDPEQAVKNGAKLGLHSLGKAAKGMTKVAIKSVLKLLAPILLKILIIVLICVLVISIIAGIISLFYNNDDGSSYGQTVSGIDGIPGQIYDFLLEKGVTPKGGAAVLGNVEQESSFDPTEVTGSYHGLWQWGHERFNALCSLASERNTEWTDVDTQIEYFWKEIDENSYYKRVQDYLYSADDVDAATEYFCRYYEGAVSSTQPGGLQELAKRQEYARKWYEEYLNNHYTTGGGAGDDILSETGTFNGTWYSSSGTKWPFYKQTGQPWSNKQFGSNSGKTIGSSGCGCITMAVIATGLTGQVITPDINLKNLNEYYPNKDYYIYNVGGVREKLFANGFTSKYYNITSTSCATMSENTIYSYLDKGYAIAGHEPGHFVAILPVSSADKANGYKFYVMDSIRGHSGKYKSFSSYKTQTGRKLEYLYLMKYEGGSSSGGTSGTGNTYGLKIVSNGKVNETNIKKLRVALENDYNLPTNTKTNSYVSTLSYRSKIGASNGNKKYNTGSWSATQKPYVTQCPWWACCRVNQYLAAYGTKYKSMRQLTSGSYGSGGEWYSRYGKYFQTGTTPKTNSILDDSGVGHVAYVEAYDSTTGYAYISHTGSGVKWYGIHKVKKGQFPWTNTARFIYITNPK